MEGDRRLPSASQDESASLKVSAKVKTMKYELWFSNDDGCDEYFLFQAENSESARRC